MLDDHTRKFIDHLVRQNRVMLFMKGNPTFPQCGFSAAVAETLKRHEIGFHHFNVLSDPAVRDGIKEYGDWPTIPQLYVDGELVGGCDIVRQLDATGELAELLAEKKTASV
jgi:monothiol glutaredoxin